MKKLLTGIITIGLLLSNVYANEPFYDTETNKIIVSGEEYGNINIIVLAPGQSIEKTDSENLPFYARQTETDGKFTHYITVPENAATGIYKVYVSGKAYGEVSYVNVKAATEYINGYINTSKTAAELLSALKGSNGILGGICENNENYLSAVSDIMIKRVPFDYSGFYGNFYKALIGAKLSSGESAENVLKEYETYSGLDYEKDYKSLNSKAKEKLGGILKAADYINRELSDIYEEAKIVSEICGAEHYSELKAVIVSNSEKIGINLSEYSDIDKTCADLMEKRELFSSYKDILKYAAETKGGKNEDGGKNPGGGGGGASGGGGGKTGGFSAAVSGNANGNKTDEKADAADGIFSDLKETIWAKTKIIALYEKNIINGKGENKFAPGDNVKRAEFAKMISLAFELGGGDYNFADVKDEDWFSEYVKACASAGIINGYNGSFYPEEDITRQDAALIIQRALAAKNKILTKTAEFSDAGDISDYAKDAVAYLAGEGVLSGFEDGSFKPLNNISRAEAAVIIYNAMQKTGGQV